MIEEKRGLEGSELEAGFDNVRLVNWQMNDGTGVGIRT